MPKIFISYRRIDTGSLAKRLYDDLAKRFSKYHVFMDTEDIRAGTIYVALVEYLHQVILTVMRLKQISMNFISLLMITEIICDWLNIGRSCAWGRPRRQRID